MEVATYVAAVFWPVSGNGSAVAKEDVAFFLTVFLRGDSEDTSFSIGFKVPFCFTCAGFSFIAVLFSAFDRRQRCSNLCF